MNVEEIESFFNEAQEGVFKLNPFASNAPVRTLLCREADLYRLSIMSTRVRNVFSEDSKAVGVESFDNEDGTVRYDICLKKEEFKELFLKLCMDLFSSVQQEADPDRYVRRIASRYAKWSRFWESPTNNMSKEAKQGLFGELLYLNKLLDSGASALEAVSCWRGPEGSDKDFIGSGWWTEVKTVRKDVQTVSISSLEQLDPKSFELGREPELKGALCIVRIDETAKAGALTLKQLVEQTAGRLSSSEQARTVFVDNLLLLGWTQKEEFEAAPLELSLYDADALGFPKLVRSSVPAGIESVLYKLSIPALAEFLTSKEGL